MGLVCEASVILDDLKQLYMFSKITGSGFFWGGEGSIMSKVWGETFGGKIVLKQSADSSLTMLIN